MKKCSKCGIEKPETSEYFPKTSKYKDGIRSECKICYKERHRKHGKEYCKINKEEIARKKKIYKHRDKNAIKIIPTVKTCIKCGVEKPSTSEYFIGTNQSESGISGTCKECRKIRDKVYVEEHDKEIKIYKKEYYQINKDRFAIAQKSYYEAHKEYHAARAKIYIKANRTQLTINAQNRRAKARKVPHTLTVEQWETIKKHFNNSCAYCGEVKPLAQDHLYPLNLGGEYSASNIICSCLSCNSSKGKKLFSNWYPKQSYYSKAREKEVLSYLKYKNNFQQLSLL